MVSAVIPVMVAMLSFSWGNKNALRSYLWSLRGYSPQIAANLPALPPQAQNVLASYGITPANFVTYIDDSSSHNLPPFWRTEDGAPDSFHVLSPIAPLAMLIPLSPERRNVYLDRFLSRRKREGWLLLPASVDYNASDDPRTERRWLMETYHNLTERYFRISRPLRLGNWTALYLTPK
jgi:hypothetical protein